MRRLIVQTFVTLDGVMQAPGGPGEDDDGGFTQGGWSVNYWDDQMGEVMGEATNKPFAMVLGRKSYDILSAYWPTAPEDTGAKVFNESPHIGMEQLSLDRGRCRRRPCRAQEGRWAGAAGSWQREPDPDLVAQQPRR
jgi:dihydrofolate reductase